MPNQMDSENVGSINMEVDAIISYSERVDSLIRSETASFYGDSPLYTFASLVDSAIRSSFASYEADNEPHSSTTTNVHSQDLSLQQSHNKSYYQTLTQQAHVHHLPHHSNEASSGVMRAQRMRWTAALHSRFFQLLSGHPSKGLNSKDGSKEENALNGLSGMVSIPSTLLTLHIEDEILQAKNLKIFTFIDLKIATRNFRPDCVLGKGASGTVFKGWIDEKTFAPTRPGTGMIIAVKRLNQELRCQGHSELLKSITWGQLHHPNLVKLIGYCLEENHRILVYEFMAKGSLDNYLFGGRYYFQLLSWTIRKKIALDVAKGLAFLPSDEVDVIYGNFKTSNILLDSNYNAKLTDFEFGTNVSEDHKTYLDILDGLYIGRVMNSSHYAARKYKLTGRQAEKSYVYTFGVVLLELMSGRRALDLNRPISEHNLVEWAKPFLLDKRKIPRVMDARMEGQYSYREAKIIANLALDCLLFEQVIPNMDEVVRSLEYLQHSKDT